jgi:hypothetical protein
MKPSRTKAGSKAGKSSPSKSPTPGIIPWIKAVGIGNCKVRGEAGEAAFLAKATSFGFGIAKPWGDSERYDFILDSGRRFWRIQVKSAFCFANSGYHVNTKPAGDEYTPDEIDFIVAYIVPLNAWYVVPIQASVGRAGLCFNPHGHGATTRLEPYRDAWCQLACPRQGPVMVNLPRRCRNTDGEDIPCPFHEKTLRP